MTLPNSGLRRKFKEQSASTMTAKTGECVRVRVAACPAAFARPPVGNEVFAWVVDLGRPPVDSGRTVRAAHRRTNRPAPRGCGT